MAVRVVIVDDHEMVRTGLATFIRANRDLELVGEASKGAQAVQLCEHLRPDVVIVDMILPDMDGPHVIAMIKSRLDTVQVIALTSFPDERLVQAAMQAGAISYLYKSISGAQLAQAIFSAHEGRPMLAPDALRRLIRNQREEQKIGFDLTEREKEVLELMAKGMNNLQIANQLIVSRSTIKAHVSSILSKLGAANRTEAATLALQEALVAH